MNLNIQQKHMIDRQLMPNFIIDEKIIKIFSIVKREDFLPNKFNIGNTSDLPFNFNEYIYNLLYDGLPINVDTGNLYSIYLGSILLISFNNDIFSNESLFIKYCFISSSLDDTYLFIFNTIYMFL